jgi:hypothetical protein
VFTHPAGYPACPACSTYLLRARVCFLHRIRDACCGAQRFQVRHALALLRVFEANRHRGGVEAQRGEAAGGEVGRVSSVCTGEVTLLRREGSMSDGWAVAVPASSSSAAVGSERTGERGVS